MLKHIPWFSLLCAVLVAGIIACLGFIAHMLLSQSGQTAVHAGAQFVRGAVCYASI